MASRATIAEQTLKVIERGNYSSATSKKPIELSKQLQLAKANTILYTPSQKTKLLKQYAKCQLTFDSSIALLGSAAYVAPQEVKDFEKMNYDEEEDTNTTTTTTTNSTDIENNNNNNNNNNNTNTNINNNNNTNTTTIFTFSNTTTTSNTDTSTVDAKPQQASAEEKKEEKREEKKEDKKEEKEGAKKEMKTYTTKFEVWHCTTLEATSTLAYDGQHPKTCLLNFASAKNPGGGFLGGAQAQEESIARSSGLYPCLTGQPKYYQENKRDPTCVYTDHIIYSPNVPVFRSDDGNLLDVPYFPSILTAPAVNWGAALHRVAGPSILVRTMKERAAMFLSIALEHDEDTLVLGAWGCGVFRFPPAICADIFYSLLVPPTAPYHGLFKHVVFAILDKNMYELFNRVFTEGPGFLDEVALRGNSRGGERGGRGRGRDEKRGGGRDNDKRGERGGRDSRGGGKDNRGGHKDSDSSKKGGHEKKNDRERRR